MLQFRVDYTRYSSVKGTSRRRVEHVMAEDITKAMDKAALICAAWDEVDHEHLYRVASIQTVGTRFTEEASIGWETGEEYMARKPDA